MGSSKTIGYWPRECLAYTKRDETFWKQVKKDRKEEKEKIVFHFGRANLRNGESEKSLLISVQGDYTIKSKQVSQSKTHSCFF